MDALALEYDLLIQREVVLGIQLHLLAPAGVALSDVRRVLTYPVAAAQCQSWMVKELPGVEVVAANSNAEAERLVAEEGDSVSAVVATAHAAQRYGHDVIATDHRDHYRHHNAHRLTSEEPRVDRKR